MGDSRKGTGHKVESNFIFSWNTFGLKIARRYYKNVHYVWCTAEFNVSKQPPTSNLSEICKKYLEQITTGNRHTKEI